MLSSKSLVNSITEHHRTRTRLNNLGQADWRSRWHDQLRAHPRMDRTWRYVHCLSVDVLDTVLDLTSRHDTPDDISLSCHHVIHTRCTVQIFSTYTM